MSIKEKAIAYLYTVISELCLHPEDIKIEHTLDERGLVLDVKANNEDMPFLIGRGGKIANSLRDVLHIYGARHNCSLKLFINRKDETNNS